MAAMEAVLAARRSAIDHPAEPAMARGPGGDLRFSVRAPLPASSAISDEVTWEA